MKTKKTLGPHKLNVLFYLFSLFSCGGSFAADAELARINNVAIKLEDFNKKYEENIKFFTLNPPKKLDVLEDLIKRELGVQEFYSLKLEKDPIIKERIDTFVFNILIEKQIGQQIQKIDISDDAARKFYEKNPMLRTSHIFVALSPKAKEGDEKKAYQKIKKIESEHLQKGQDFGLVAQKFSEGPTSAIGGDLDYQNRGGLDPVYYEAALALKIPGRVSGIIRSSVGYHIIKLTAIKTWFDVDHALIKRQVYDVAKKKIFDDYMQKLRDKAIVIVSPDLIKD
jgi:parvulin-like peptidyl-prolyl isomerase